MKGVCLPTQTCGFRAGLPETINKMGEDEDGPLKTNKYYKKT